MKKRGLVYLLVLLVLSAAAMILRRTELLTVLDSVGLAVFRPVTAVLAALCVLAAVFCILYARRFVEARTGPAYTVEYRSLGLVGVILAVVCLPVQLYGAWFRFLAWRASGKPLDLITALLAGLAGAGWLSLRIEEMRGELHFGSRLLSGSLVVLFYCLWVISYYRDEAPEPTLILTVYAFLALCVCVLAAYNYTGGSVGRLRPRRTLVYCGLALFLSLVALVRQEAVAYRLFWLVGAVQFALCAFVLLDPGERLPEPEKEGEEAGGETPESAENAEAEGETPVTEPAEEEGELPETVEPAEAADAVPEPAEPVVVGEEEK